MRSRRPGPGYPIGMAEWMTIGELAEECRADVYALREALELLGLFDVGEPTPLAVRHSLATPEVDDGGRAISLWHADAVTLARAVLSGGQFGDASASYGPSASEDAEPEYVQGDLFDVEAEIETVGERDAGGPAAGGAGGTSARKEAAGNVGAGPIGRIVEGFDAIVATDGACSGNPGPGGWAWVEQVTGERDCGGAAHTTNNAMELTALVRALEHVGPQPDLLMRIDSQYAIKAMTVWAKAWRRKGWRKSDGAPVANRDLVERLLELYEGRQGRTEVEWVKGHSGDAANELVDSMAAAQAARHRR